MADSARLAEQQLTSPPALFWFCLQLLSNHAPSQISTPFSHSLLKTSHKMSFLTQEERNTIAENPLNGELTAVREALRDAEQSSSSRHSQLDGSADAPERPRLFTEGIRRLLAILTASDVAIGLASRIGRDNLGSDLTVVRRRVQNGDFEYKHFRQLTRRVIEEAPDADIWDAVIALVVSGSQSTPPPTLPPSFNDTPITHSSASQQGSEQTRQKIEARLFEEIHNCTHQNVQGFHAKYFENKSWSKRADQVWESVKSHHDNGRWRDFPTPPTQDRVYDWWFDLQTKYLDDARSAYHKSNTNDMVSKEAKRQLDLFVKAKIDGASGSRHDWKDVLVVGELKVSNHDWKATLLQVARYVRDVFSHQPTRLFVHAFTLCGAEIETWVFDRSGPYSAGTFNIHNEPERFIQIMCGYAMMDDEELGLDTITEKQGDQLFVTVFANKASGKKQERTKLEIEHEPIVYQRAIVCRGTCVHRAKVAQTGSSSSFDSVLKRSWVSDMRAPEANLLKKAHQRGVEGLANLIGSREVSSIQELRSGLVFNKEPHRFRGTAGGNSSFSQSQQLLCQPSSRWHGFRSASNPPKRKRSLVDAGSNTSKRSRSSSQRRAGAEHAENQVTFPIQEAGGTSLVQQSNTTFDNRILRVLAISPAGKAISQFNTTTELLEGLRDAIKAHRSLYKDGKILHRDISENNIIIPSDFEKAGGYKGVLIDLDLAKEVGAGPSGIRHRTGTMEFMAIEVLLGISHTYRHDLESFFYILIWLCARRGWYLSEDKEHQPEDIMLSEWYTGSYELIANSKRGSMDGGGLEQILKKFPPSFECVKPLCMTIRDVLFPYYKRGLFTGTPQDSDILYLPMIRAFDDTLATIRQEEENETS